VQLELAARTWGGRREGAGRLRTTGWVSRKPRPQFPARHPQHVTLRIRRDVGSLRDEVVFLEIQQSLLKAHNRFGMRVIEFSIQDDHIHLVVEADEGKKSLSKGIQGLAIRSARAVNRALGRRGKVFADRYHANVLDNPTQVRNAVEYVRHNYQKHQEKAGRPMHPFYIDPFSSMSGRASTYMHSYSLGIPVVAVPQTWLLRYALA
jgi:REP element-mobilizing transposase RayT